MRVPHTLLKPETLRAVIEDFVTREGTDYGATERSFESKVAEVMGQLEQGRAFVTYDEASDSCSIVAKDGPVNAPAQSPYADRREARYMDERSQEVPSYWDHAQADRDDP